MSEIFTGYEGLDAQLAQCIDETCDRFEKRWQAGERPAIDAFLGNLTGRERLILLRELVLLDIAYRRQAGEVPRPEEYRGRFPEPEATWLEEMPAPEAGQRPLPVPASSPITLPGYRVEGEIGRGGMGVVYKARQLKLNRLVALKMLSTGAPVAPADLARFRAEADILGRLQHPNVVQIFDVQEQNGQPYFVMEFVEGGSLDRG